MEESEKEVPSEAPVSHWPRVLGQQASSAMKSLIEQKPPVTTRFDRIHAPNSPTFFTTGKALMSLFKQTVIGLPVVLVALGVIWLTLGHHFQ